jgi:hypothetical protein
MRTSTDVLRKKLAQEPPPPGWSDPEPSGGESHWIVLWTKPACGLPLHYSGERHEVPPAPPCEECKAHAR